MKRVYLIFLYFSAFLSLAVQCEDDTPVPVYRPQFIEEVSITPFKKEYKEGDTILLETLIPDKNLFNLRTEQDTLIDNRNIPFSTSLMLLKGTRTYI